MKKLSYAFIIRLHYPEDNRPFEDRFALFRTMTYPRIRAQSDQDFDICIWCNEWHKEAIKSLDPDIKTFHVSEEAREVMAKKFTDKRNKYHVDWTAWHNVRGLKQYDVQMGLDSDDLIMLDYVKTIKEIVDEHRDTSLHINFQPLMFEMDRLSWYTCPIRYHEDKGSPFFALYQPNKEEYIFAYEDSHLQLGQFMERSVTVRDDDFCAFIVHGNNESTRLFERSRMIPPPGQSTFISTMKFFVNTLRRSLRTLLDW